MIKYDVQVTEQIYGEARNLGGVARHMREDGIIHPQPEDVERYVAYAVEAHAEIAGICKLAFSGVGSRHSNEWRVEPEFKDCDELNPESVT